MLFMIAGHAPRQSLVCLTFMIIKISLVYNAILGQPGLNALHIVVLTYYLLMKFPTSRGVNEVYGNQALAKQCYMVSLQARPHSAILVEGLDTRDELIKEWGEPAKDLLAI